ncbi:VTC domain-containing protein [Pilobolus umbonatus]|nr:VTC domain-containing protein [Pilobolus umbonatus]
MFSIHYKDYIRAQWEGEYVAYDAIYEGIIRRCKSECWTDKDEKDFKSTIKLEAMKVDLFISRKQREIESRIRHLNNILFHLNHEDRRLNTIHESIKKITSDIYEINLFIHVNYKAIEQLVCTHNALINKNSQKFFFNVIKERCLDNQRLDSLIIKNGQLLNKYNQIKSGRDDKKTDGQCYHGRFWLHPHNVKEVMATLSFHLPFRGRQSDYDEFISSIYLDNDNLDGYASQLQFDNDTEMIRCYWKDAMEHKNEVYIEKYTSNKKDVKTEINKRIIMDKDQASNFFGMKYTADNYAQDLKEQGCSDSYVMESYTIAKSIQDIINRTGVYPKLLVSENCSVYESLYDNISIKLLDGITFVKGDLFSYLKKPGGYTSLSPVISDEDLCTLPISVLDVNLTCARIPPWLDELIRTRLIYEVPRFSLYVQGIQHFYGPQLPILPWWASQLEKCIVHTDSNKYMKSWSNQLILSDQDEYHIGYLETEIGRLAPVYESNIRTDKIKDEFIVQLENVPDHHTHNLTQTDCSDLFRLGASEKTEYDEDLSTSSFVDFYYKGRHQSQVYLLNDINDMNTKKKEKKKKQFLEPKIFFANERTFIHWLQFAAFILTSAVTLMNFGDQISVISGGVFLGISLVIAVYAFLRNRYRAHQINTAPTLRYDDLYGPIGLCCLLLGAMLLNAILRVNHPSTTDTYLGINKTLDRVS